MNPIFRAISNLVSRRPQRLNHPKDARAADVYEKVDSLATLHDQTTLSLGKDEMTLSSPAIGSQPLTLSQEDGKLHATLDGNELGVTHRGAQRFFSSGGAVGTDPAHDTIELPGGRQVTVTQWSSSWEVKVKQDDAPVTLDMWFKADAGSPSTVKFQKSGLDVRLGSDGLSIEEQPKSDGPVRGHLTSMRKGEFESRHWSNGFCDPVSTSEQDIERVVTGTSELLSVGGALFASDSL